MQSIDLKTPYAPEPVPALSVRPHPVGCGIDRKSAALLSATTVKA